MSEIIYESQRIVSTNNEEKIKITSPEDVEKLKQVIDIKDKVQEHFIVITLNNKSMVNSIELVGIGSSSSILINASDVIRCALLRGSASMILVHNHPSGDVTPSKHDLYFTKRINSMASLFNVRLADHIIIGNKTLSMLRENMIDTDKDIENLKQDIIKELQEENKKLKERQLETIQSKIYKAKEKAKEQNSSSRCRDPLKNKRNDTTL